MEALQKQCSPGITAQYYAALLKIALSEEYYWQQHSPVANTEHQATQEFYLHEESKLHDINQTEVKEMLHTMLLQQLRLKLGAYFSDAQIQTMLVDPLLDCILSPSTLAAQKIMERIKTMLAHMHISPDNMQDILTTLLADLSGSSIIDLTQLLSILKDTVQYQYIFGEDTHE